MRNDRLFMYFLLAFLLFDYFVLKHSFIWILCEFCLLILSYYLLYFCRFTKNLSKIVKILFTEGLIVAFFYFTIFVPKNSLWMYQGSEYTQATWSFNLIDHSQIKERLNRESKSIRFLYIGRESCPFCKKFVPKLKEAAKNAKVTVYYIDTEIKSDELYDFAENYQIDSIPSLLVLNDGHQEKKLTDGSQLTVEELTKFLKDNKK